MYEPPGHVPQVQAPNNLQGGAGKLVVTFLDRDFYPAGAWKGLWDDPNIAGNKQLVVLHNNWIKGLRAKAERLMQRGLWWYNRDALICSYEPRPSFALNWNIDDFTPTFDAE